MELEEIRHLIEFLQETDITELEIEREGAKIRIKREKIMPSSELPVSVKHSETEKVPVKEEPEEDQTLVTITSPIVGVFYRAPSPESPPFVEIGSPVRKGQVLCIVEAMKLMNEIESDRDGIISKILIENGQPVEYGEPLFLVEPKP
jgi:acetyl-CoA carboxylase biotin carboxyl carrier protein